jgi:hypothetical protein
LGARFRRLHRRFGKTGGKKAAVAVVHTLLIIVWHILHDTVDYTDLGADYYIRRDDPDARKNRLLRQTRELGYDADLTPLAALPPRSKAGQPSRPPLTVESRLSIGMA